MANYITADDVKNAGTGGRLASFFGSLGTDAQASYLAAATDRVDQITGQAGGPGALNAQADRTYTVLVGQGTDTLHLPNKPVTRVSAIVVKSMGGAQLANYFCEDGRTVFRTGGRSFRYVAAGSVPPPFSRSSWGQPFPQDSIVTVTYDAGYESGHLPESVKRGAVMVLAADLFGFADNAGGALELRDQGSMLIYGRQIVGNALMREAHLALEPHALGYVPLTAI